MPRPAIFLDRDGVINSYVYNTEFGTVDSPARPEEFQLISGVHRAIREFQSMGAAVAVVSNQPGIAKARFSRELLEAVTEKMLRSLDGLLSGVYYCLHHPSASVTAYRIECDCRKPKPGLLLQAARELDLDLTRSVMIGDGLTDIVAGRSAGTRTILVNTRKCYLCDVMTQQGVEPDFIVPSLSASVLTVAELFKKWKA